MKYLTGQDAFLANIESGNVYQHVCSAVILDPSTALEEFTVDTLRQFTSSKLHLIPSFRQRLIEVPYRLGPPAFVTYAEFDINEHILEINLPENSPLSRLEEITSNLLSQPLDRDKPLWQMLLVDGLQDGLKAIICKMHHCMIDGHSGGELLQHFFALEPVDVTEKEVPANDEDQTDDCDTSSFSWFKMAVGSTRTYMDNRPKVSDVLRKTAKGLVSARKTAKALKVKSRPFQRLFFNRTLTPNRSMAFCKISLSDIKTIKNAYNVTVNDAVLAATTLCLRNYLIIHNDLPDTAITCCVPVDNHGNEDNTAGAVNQVGVMGVELPVHISDPDQIIKHISSSSKASKAIFAANYSNLLNDVSDLMPGVTAFVAGQYSKRKLGNVVPQPYNLVVSNVPGTPIPLYWAGARVVGMYPAGPIIEGQGLNISLISYLDSFDLGVVGCKEYTPDLDLITDGFQRAVEKLKAEALVKQGHNVETEESKESDESGEASEEASAA